MSIVSITQASKLTGKSRQTLYKHINSGQLSLSTDINGSKGVDTSELLRIYGTLNIDKLTTVQVDTAGHKLTKQNNNIVNTDNKRLTELEIELTLSKLKIDEQQKQLDLKQDTINAKQETIDTLKSALKLLEHKQTKDELAQTAPIPLKAEQPLPEPQETVPTDTVTEAKELVDPPSSGFWSGFKNLFK